MNSKYYVVWVGRATGIFESWEECKDAVENYKGAKYKAFSTLQAATQAFRDDPDDHIILRQIGKFAQQEKPQPAAHIIRESLAVDAACSENPGDMEYRGVYIATGQEVFRIGPMKQGTNNIGEFLAIVHGLALLKQKNNPMPIYSDSRNAIAWVRQKKCKTQLERTAANEPIFQLIARAEAWLQNNSYTTRIIKWETSEWGEIPADFGRK